MRSWTIETSTPDPTDKWDRASTSTNWSYERYRWGGKSKWSFMVPEIWKDGRSLYFVYVIYSTGDSFGHAAGENCEGIGVYDSLEGAEDVERAIWADYKVKDSYNPYERSLTVGTQKIYTYPWKGYFEFLDDVIVKKLC